MRVRPLPAAEGRLQHLPLDQPAHEVGQRRSRDVVYRQRRFARVGRDTPMSHGLAQIAFSDVGLMAVAATETGLLGDAEPRGYPVRRGYALEVLVIERQ